MAPSISDYLGYLKKQNDATKERLEFFTARGVSTDQEKILLYFLQRDYQLGESCYLLAEAQLRPGLFALKRVLCEDLFLSYFVSKSEEDAAKYKGEVLSEITRILKVHLDRDRAELVDRNTGKAIDEATRAEVVSQINKSITPRKERPKIEEIAKSCGLSKVYDTVYRVASLDVHGKILDVLGLREIDEKEGIRAALAAIVVLLRALVMIVNNRLQGRGTTAKEILRTLKVETIAGK